MIGLTGADLRIDLRIALRAARTALPVVAVERQQIMATAVLNRPGSDGGSQSTEDESHASTEEVRR
jgi:hypothetical protein